MPERPESAWSVSRGINFGDISEEEAERTMQDPHGFLNRSLNRDQLGAHWSQDQGTAESFATGEWSGGQGFGGEVYGESPNYEDDEEPREQPFGVVLSGHVHERNIVDPESEEREDYSNPMTEMDEEVVRWGSRVHVNEAEFFRGDRSLGRVSGRWSGRA